MPSGSVDPLQSPSAVGPINDARVGIVAPGRIGPVGDRAPRPDASRTEYEDHDRMEIHVDGVARRAYAQFLTHPETGQVSIKIIDADTKQVVREIPSEEVIRLAEQLQSYWDARNKRFEAK